MSSKQNVTTRVVSYIKENLKNEIWRVGEKIPSENEMCKQLEVSRASVRNALQQFIALGLLECHRGKGTYVLSNNMEPFGTGRLESGDLSTIAQTLELRRIIETEVCAIAAEKISDEALVQLELCFQKMQTSVGQRQAFINHDLDFHRIIWATTNNQIIISVLENILAEKQQIGLKLNTAAGYYGGLYYHELILNALKKHDSKRAYQIMREHLQKNIDELELS